MTPNKIRGQGEVVSFDAECHQLIVYLDESSNRGAGNHLGAWLILFSATTHMVERSRAERAHGIPNMPAVTPLLFLPPREVYRMLARIRLL